MLSNIFLILPVFFAGVYHAWLYFFALGLVIFSPLYHWYRIHKPHTSLFLLFEICDIAFAIGAFVYMHYYIYAHGSQEYAVSLFALLTAVVLFFLYGHRRRYKKVHPWFHIVAPVVSSRILVMTHVD